VQRPVETKNTAKRKTAAYSLSYFTLWWKRMEEGRKDAKRMERMVEEETKCQKTKR
jgi:hypothetical protein